jgi:Cthe_2314-like HEPN
MRMAGLCYDTQPVEAMTFPVEIPDKALAPCRKTFIRENLGGCSQDSGEMSLPNKKIHNPQYYRLFEHPFVLSVLENEKIASAPLSNQAFQTYQLGQIPKFTFTPEMAYHHNINHYFGNLIGTVERIEQVPIFLRRFPNSKFFDENNITLHQWIKYHYTNYLIMSVSLYDISLLLTNEVFMLGIEARFCNKEKIAKHKCVSKTSVKSSLDKLEQAIDEYRDPRHLFVHRGHTPAMGFMDRLEDYSFIQKMESEFGLEKEAIDLLNPLSSPIVLRDLYKYERRKLITQIKEKTHSFIDLLVELFNSQKPIYDALSKYCRSHPSAQVHC